MARRRPRRALSNAVLTTDKVPKWNLGLGASTRTCSRVGDKDAIQVCLTRPRTPGKTISTPESVCELLQGARYRDRESFYVISLSSRADVLGVEEVHRGTANAVEVHPREVFKSPILLGAAAIVVAHNHPSGSTLPSQDDIDLTKRMGDAGRLIGVPVLDHIIVGGKTGCYSIRGSHPQTLEGLKRHRRVKRRR